MKTPSAFQSCLRRLPIIDAAPFVNSIRWHEMPSGDYSGSSSDIDGLGYVIVAGRRLPHRRGWRSLKCVKTRRADFTKLHIGGQVKAAGWEVLDANPGPIVDHVANARDLSVA